MNSRTDIARLQTEGRHIRITWSDHHESLFESYWLRDNCPTGEYVVENSTQKLCDAIDLPDELAPANVEITADNVVKITWRPDGVVSLFKPSWLREHCLSSTARKHRRRQAAPWDRASLAQIPRVDFKLLESLETLLKLFASVGETGICLVQNAPLQPNTVAIVAEQLGYIRQTNYGRVFDVTSEAGHSHLANTVRGLEVHTDNPYRNPPPGVQLLQCMCASESGGETILVDGFRIAEELRATSPSAFETLSRVPQLFRYADHDVDLQHSVKVIETNFEDQVEAVHFNGRSAATLDVPEDQVAAFYDAYRAFGKLVRNHAFRFEFRMQPGDLLVFNNRRILHGRKAYRDGASPRLLQGCYIDVDEFYSRWRKLQSQVAVADQPGQETLATQ